MSSRISYKAEEDNNMFMEMVTSAIFEELDENPDVVFIFPHDDATLVAGKLKIANASPVFKDIFDASTEPVEQIVIKDIRFEIFSKMMRFIYEGVVEILEGNYLEILAISTMYLVNALTYQVVRFLQKFLTAENVAENYELFAMYNMKILQDHVKGLCQTHPVQIIDTLAASEAHKWMLRVILDSSNLPCSEYDLYKAIMKTVTRISSKNPYNQRTLSPRDVLGDMIYLIRFPTMSIEELLACARPPTPLTPREVLDILLWVDQKYSSDTTLLKYSIVPRCSIPRV